MQSWYVWQVQRCGVPVTVCGECWSSRSDCSSTAGGESASAGLSAVWTPGAIDCDGLYPLL